jgi:hypothetical protein
MSVNLVSQSIRMRRFDKLRQSISPEFLPGYFHETNARLVYQLPAVRSGCPNGSAKKKFTAHERHDH